MKISAISSMCSCQGRETSQSHKPEMGLVLKSSVTKKTYELWINETTCHALGISFQDLQEIVKELSDMQGKLNNS